MKIHVLAVTVLLAAAQAGRAQVKDLAELFPAKTRVYLEINGVADVVKEVRGLVKGSCLEDPPKSLEKFAKQLQNPVFFAEIVEYGVLLSPEALNEMSRFRGGAIAFTGFSKDAEKTPQVVAVLQAGQSNLPVLFTRLVMSNPLAKKVAEVEGVRLYRSQEQVFEKPQGDRFPIRETGPVVALMPGVVIVGSDTEGVGDVIRRLKGKANGASLATVTDFQKAADLRAQPGLFAYADGSALIHASVATIQWMKQRSSAYPVPVTPPAKLEDQKELPRTNNETVSVQVKQEKGVTGVFQEILELAKGFRAISVNLTLKDGSAVIRGNVVLDPKAKTPWPEFFSARTIDLNLLRFVPKQSRLALLAAMPEGTGFWDKLGKAAPLLETELSLALGKDLLKIARVGLMDGGRNGPILLVEATDAAGAPDLAVILGKYLKVEKQTKGRLIALGKDRKVLAGVLAGQGLSADKIVFEALKGHQQANVLVAWSVGQTILEAIRQDGIRPSGPPVLDKKIEFDKKPVDKEQVLFQEVIKQPDIKEPPDPSRMLLQLAKRSAEALEPLPPFVLSLSKKSDQLILSGRQVQLHMLAPRLIDILVEWELTSPRYGNYTLEAPLPMKAPPKEAK